MMSTITRPFLSTETDDRRRLTRPSAGLQKLIRAADHIPGRPPSPRFNITVSHSHQLVWFRVAKVGTRSIFETLRRADVSLDFEEPFGVNAPRAVTPGYVRAAFVRHPVERFLSGWQSTVLKMNYFGFAAGEYDEMKHLPTFLDWFTAQDPTTCDVHLRLQSALVPDGRLDLLGRMESFSGDLLQLLQLIGAPPTAMPRVNASPHQPPKLTASERQHLETIYRPDFERFGYEPGDRSTHR